MSLSPDKQRSQAWSRYWATGAAHSCASSFDGRYGGSLGAGWRRCFEALPADARVLDLACGNGALARLLCEQRPEPGLRCDAVDLADIAPDWAAGDPRLTFHARTGAEALPFPDQHFHLVASQYGIEYADLDRALAEAMRVCRRGGQLRLVMHHTMSRPCELAREERLHVLWLRQPDGWLAAARQMLEPMSLVGSPQGQARLAAEPRFHQIRQAFDAAQAQRAARRDASICGDLLDDVETWATQVFRLAGQREAVTADAGWRKLLELVDDADCRLADLLDHALDDEALDRVMALPRSQGWQVAVDPVLDQHRLMGVACDLRRPQGA